MAISVTNNQGALAEVSQTYTESKLLLSGAHNTVYVYALSSTDCSSKQLNLYIFSISQPFLLVIP